MYVYSLNSTVWQTIWQQLHDVNKIVSVVNHFRQSVQEIITVKNQAGVHFIIRFFFDAFMLAKENI